MKILSLVCVRPPVWLLNYVEMAPTRNFLGMGGAHLAPPPPWICFCTCGQNGGGRVDLNLNKIPAGHILTSESVACGEPNYGWGEFPGCVFEKPWVFMRFRALMKNCWWAFCWSVRLFFSGDEGKIGWAAGARGNLPSGGRFGPNAHVGKPLLKSFCPQCTPEVNGCWGKNSRGRCRLWGGGLGGGGPLVRPPFPSLPLGPHRKVSQGGVFFFVPSFFVSPPNQTKKQPLFFFPIFRRRRKRSRRGENMTVFVTKPGMAGPYSQLQ